LLFLWRIAPAQDRWPRRPATAIEAKGPRPEGTRPLHARLPPAASYRWSRRTPPQSGGVVEAGGDGHARTGHRHG